jgi:hypothetical protein
MHCRSGFSLVVYAILIASHFCVFPSICNAMIRTVGPGAGFDFNNIQAAINSANNGDEIVISPGIYTGSINFLTKDIHLTSIDPSDANIRETTILAPPNPIDASTNGSLKGFRINGGITFGYNNFPDVRSYSPLIKNNHIVTGATAIDILVGYEQVAPTPIIENNVIEAQTGVYIFVQAFGGGMGGFIRNNTFAGDGTGAGILYRTHKEMPMVSNNIITNFDYGWLLTYHSQEAARKARFNYNNVFGNDENYFFGTGPSGSFDMTGIQGNISVDPLFLDQANGDFRLASGSPMIDAGWDAGVATDINGFSRPFDVLSIDNNGSRPEFDMGAYEYVPEPDGKVLWLSGMALFATIVRCRHR